MANELSGNEPTQFGGPAVRPEPNAWDVIKKILQPIASLKLTVALFSMGLFVIFVGTLAQDKMEIWRAVDLYFHAWTIKIPINVFFPSEWFPDLQDTKGAIWFPGGMLIGVMMMINLTAAHTVRFKVQASGGRLASGLSVIGLGAIVTLVVILSGHNADGLQGEPPFEWSTFWKICKIGVVALFLASLFGTAHVFVKLKRDRVLERLAMLFTNGVLLALVIFLWNIGHTDAALRIVWQMAQGTIAALVLLGGCILVFKRRAGIAVLHTGVMLLMVNELIVANHAVEERMSFSEGETVNYASDIRAVELAVTDRSGSKEKVIVVPFAHHGTLTMHVEDNRVLRHSLLPFDVQVMKYLENSTDLRALVDGESTLATRGIGRYQTVDNIVSVAGADIGGSVNHSSAFLKLTNKTDADLGTYLLSQWAGEAPELITVDGKTYEVVLRFKRQYKPYSITLLDTGRREYVGTSTPRDFYSDVDLIDPSRNFELKGKKIWMNNPLRYAGETFYQSGHNIFNGVEYSTLQIVKNRGWMTPYVACGIVAIGMFAHFWIVLVRFLKRVSTNPTVKWGVIGTSMNALTSLFEMALGAKDPPKEEPASETPKRPQKPSPRPALQRRVQTPQPSLARPAPTNKFVNIGLPIAAVVVCCAWLFSRVPTPEPKAGEFNLYEFGKLPVAYEGRVKPIDTLARNTMRIISGRETFKDENDDRQDAIRWLMDVIAKPEVAVKYKVFRIDNLEVLETMGLERRKGYRYSIEEIRVKYPDFVEQTRLAHIQFAEYKKTKKNRLSTYQKKLIEVEGKLNRYSLLVRAFTPSEIPSLPTLQEIQENQAEAQRKVQEFRTTFRKLHAATEKAEPPLAIPVRGHRNPWMNGDDHWQSYPEGWAWALFEQRVGQRPNEAVIHLETIFHAYEKGNAKTFNDAVAKYRYMLEELDEEEERERETSQEKTTSTQLSTSKLDMEAWFNHFSAFHVCIGLYLIVFFVALIGILTWALGWNPPIQRVAFWVTFVTFIVHTIALWMRIEISGRPPVTNLYSSAVFIGWACVMAGMVFELVFRLGLGNIISSVTGFATLLIAHGLAGDGDTLKVLIAVLDTQFWLSTHVICVTIGYAATYLAGLLGLMYIIIGISSPLLAEKVGDQWTVGKVLTTLIYGVVCFAVFFSLVGTVLGGLWADDSWGRFWGWDPKENGALIIVFWNVLVLHARWGGMIKDRGLAVLAIWGIVATTWSWFAVNQLGIGLHAYGFTEGVLMAVGYVFLGVILMTGIALLPKNLWWSFRAEKSQRSQIVDAERM